MKTYNFPQGSPEWLGLKDQFPESASKYPAALGVGKYQSYDSLIKELATGTKEDLSKLQWLFDKGHKVEALARPKANEIVGETLTAVTGVNEETNLLASFDGITFDESITWEHKLWQADLAASVENGIVPDTHSPQLDHGFHVSGAKKCLFMVSELSDDEQSITRQVWCWYERDEAKVEAVPRVWKQVELDVAAYVPTETAEKSVAEPIQQLPAITWQFKENKLAVTNLGAYRDAALELVEKARLPMETDQDFVDGEALVKVFKDAETRIKAAKDSVLGELQDIDQFTKDLDFIYDNIRTARLAKEKSIKTEKESRKQVIMGAIIDDATAHKAATYDRIGFVFDSPPIDVGGAIKGKRNLEAIQSAANAELSRWKIAFGEVADKVDTNVRWFNSDVDDRYLELFPDRGTFIALDHEAFQARVKMRIHDHLEKLKEIEAQKAAEAQQAKDLPDLGAHNPPPAGRQIVSGPERVSSPVEVIEQAGASLPRSSDYQAGVIDGLAMFNQAISDFYENNENGLEPDHSALFKRLVDEFLKTGRAA
jgi:predicted phage-related endonuclease